MESTEMGAARVALVTGGSGGIGRASVRAFAQAGYRVVVADLDAAGAEAVATEVCAGGGEALPVQVDIARRDSVEAMIEQVRARYGRLDAAFNNAGVGVPRKPLVECEDEAWQACVSVNLTGTWNCLKAEIRWMLELGGGCIVNNGSVFALRAGPNAPYTATKHAIAGLTKSAAMTYAAQNVRVNAVCPGLIDAGMGAPVIAYARDRQRPEPLIERTPAARPGRAEEVAQTVLWLCSEQASFIHGQLLAIDGGYSA